MGWTAARPAFAWGLRRGRPAQRASPTNHRGSWGGGRSIKMDGFPGTIGACAADARPGPRADCSIGAERSDLGFPGELPDKSAEKKTWESCCQNCRTGHFTPVC